MSLWDGIEVFDEGTGIRELGDPFPKRWIQEPLVIL